MNNRRLILNIAKKHYIKKDWYDGWSTNTNWQKCIFDGVREIFGYDTACRYDRVAYALLNAYGIQITEEIKHKCKKNAFSFCFEVMDKYYTLKFVNSCLDLE